MGLFYITFRSITFAQRGEKLLTQKNIRVSLMRTPRWMEEQGCGYALKLWCQDIGSVVKLLRESRIQLRKTYIQREDGAMEEVKVGSIWTTEPLPSTSRHRYTGQYKKRYAAAPIQEEAAMKRPGKLLM